ncbi:MAG: hypothetical protein ACTS4Y_01050 [Candidatus Hodgkinia cicadicola]
MNNILGCNSTEVALELGLWPSPIELNGLRLVNPSFNSAERAPPNEVKVILAR